MGLSGNLGTMSLPEILEWASNGAKTGTLGVRHESVEKRILFKTGRIYSSWSNDPRDYLGQFLVGYGLITEEQLFRALLLQEKEGQLLGAILVESGIIAEEDLKLAMQRKAREAVFSLFLLPHGRFEFVEGEVPEGLVALDMSVTEVIFEGVRRVDEWGRLRQIFPTMQTTLATVPGVARPEDPVRARAFDLAAGGKTVEEISLDLHRSDFDAACLLRELHERGLIVVSAVREDAPATDRILGIQGLLARAEQRLREGRLKAARDVYEEVLQLDRLNQKAKKGLLFVEETLAQQAGGPALPLDAVPYLSRPLNSLTTEKLDALEGFLLSRVNGEWDVQAILKVCPMAESDALSLLAGLVDRGVIALR